MLREGQLIYIGDRLWDIAKSLVADYSAEPLSRILPHPPAVGHNAPTGDEILRSLKEKLEERRRKRESV